MADKGVDVVVPARRRGRPPVVVTEEVLNNRRLSKQRVNAQRSESVDGQGPSRKRGRPPIVVTEEVLEQHRLARQRVNARRRKGAGATHSAPVEGGPGDGGDGADPQLEAVKEGPSESQRIRKSIERKKREFMETNVVLSLGRQEETCGFFKAQVWSAEFTGRQCGSGPKGYTICYGKGKVVLPLLRPPPPELSCLIIPGTAASLEFFNKGRVYNIFAFCSFGGNIDNSINNGRGPYVFRVGGRIYHSLGSLVPPDGLTPKFAQIYMFDGQEAVAHRLNFLGNLGAVEPATITKLQEMLERENVLAGIFKQLRDRYTYSEAEPVCLRLLERRKTDGRFESMPSANDYEFAALVVDNNFVSSRNIVAEHKQRGLQHISDLHPSYMSLQYPLLFPYGEDGYRTNIRHRNADESGNDKRGTVSMREYYAFRAQYRIGEGNALLLGGRLFLQYIVDAWCSVERGRLLWVETHQSIIRSDLYNNIVDSVSRGDVDATEVGKRLILPSSFTGGYWYMQQNFQDSLAGCKEYGHPDLFITFTCNPKWDEIQESVRTSGSRDASVRPDIVARVFKMKLDSMINDFTKKNVLGRVLAGYRYMQQNFQDSLAVCKEYGHPDLFITFTCNPKWDEIQESVRTSGSRDASVRPDIVARVFKMKLDSMINDFTKKNVLGRVLAGRPTLCSTKGTKVYYDPDYGNYSHISKTVTTEYGTVMCPLPRNTMEEETRTHNCSPRKHTINTLIAAQSTPQQKAALHNATIIALQPITCWPWNSCAICSA